VVRDLTQKNPGFWVWVFGLGPDPRQSETQFKMSDSGMHFLAVIIAW